MSNAETLAKELGIKFISHSLFSGFGFKSESELVVYLKHKSYVKKARDILGEYEGNGVVFEYKVIGAVKLL